MRPAHPRTIMCASASSRLDSPRPVREELDLRGLICSILHQWRESSACNQRDLTFVDEHPYAIVNVDRSAISLALRMFLECIGGSASRSVVVVRLYSTEEELCVELSDGACQSRPGSGLPHGTSDGKIAADLELAQRVLAANAASFRAQRDAAGAVFTIAFQRDSL
jgi:hypothetical protein